MTKTHTYEVYGLGYGYLGWVTAKSLIGAKRAAQQMWPDCAVFSFTQL